MKITFNELRKLKDSLPDGSMHKIADDLNLTDWLFRYGVRVNTNLVQDMVAGGINDRKAIHRWIYFPLSKIT